MKLSELNRSNNIGAEKMFGLCCSAKRWAKGMSQARPYSSMNSLLDKANTIWEIMEETDYFEAFDGHPKIGDPDSLKKKYRNSLSMASNEQSTIEFASQKIIEDLAKMNEQYEKRFGYIFIVCATGKSAAEILNLIKLRIENQAKEELAIAASEQAKITIIRINNLFQDD